MKGGCITTILQLHKAELLYVNEHINAHHK